MRICGVCRRPPREGDEMRPMRVHPGDLDIEPGLYQACPECIEAHRPKVAARFGVPVDQVTNNMLC